MTIQGTVDKTAILLAVTIFAAIWPGDCCSNRATRGWSCPGC